MIFCQILDFDSKLFGFKVAKILPVKIDFKNLQMILKALREEKVVLAYWACAYGDQTSQIAAEKTHGFLADIKVTYKMHLNALPQVARLADIGKEIRLFPNEKTQGEDRVLEYKNHRSTITLQKLACAAGEHSRFKTDSKVPTRLRIKLYKKWLANSLCGKIAEHVLVYKVNRKTVGLITLGSKNKRGEIGLLAVDSEFRCRKIGMKLVFAAQRQLQDDGYRTAQVITQLNNVAACRLYEKCGFTREKLEHFYHFWL